MTSLPSAADAANPPLSVSARTQATAGQLRDQTLDVAKGIGIVLVVLGHCLIGLRSSNFFTPGAERLWAEDTDYTIYLFHMPLFFVVSGYLTSLRHRPAGSMFKNLLVYIVYPYFLWSILQGLVQIFFAADTNGHMGIGRLYQILWNPITPYWFLYSLFFCQLGYLAIRKLSLPLQTAVAAVAMLVPLIFYKQMGGGAMDIVPITTRSFFFFVLGGIAAPLVRSVGRWTAVLSTILFALFAVIAYPILWGNHGLIVLNTPGATLLSLLPTTAGIVATLGWSRSLVSHSEWGTRVLAFFGQYSMSIFVMHLFFTAGLRIALYHFHLRNDSSAVAVVLQIIVPTALATVLPLEINWLVSRVGLHRLLGLQAMKTQGKPAH